MRITHRRESFCDRIGRNGLYRLEHVRVSAIPGDATTGSEVQRNAEVAPPLAFILEMGLRKVPHGRIDAILPCTVSPAHFSRGSARS